jgi:hypothetical protein
VPQVWTPRVNTKEASEALPLLSTSLAALGDALIVQ